MSPDSCALLAFEVNRAVSSAIATDAETSEPERARRWRALERARLEAAHFLLWRGNAEDRRLAVRWAFRSRKSQ